MEEQIRFHTAFWGYRRAHVHEYLSQLRRDFEAKREELITKNRELIAQNEALAAKLAELEAQLAKYQEQEQVIAQVLVDAQVRAAAIEREAREGAERIKEEIMAEIAIRRTELRDINARVEEFKKDFMRMLDDYKASLSVHDARFTEDEGSIFEAGAKLKED
ncbi:MAG: hypothetical protein HPY71_03255 [Firmicutes bacterium]|nr:hypothetical protein [Bacillota bacterium]